MKKFFKAYKLYMKTSFSPIMTIFCSFMCIGLFFAAFASPEKSSSKEYLAMIGVIGMGHLFIFLNFIMGIFSTRNYKFFMSTESAKKLYTVVPMVSTLTVCLIYDIIMYVIAYFAWDSAGKSDILIVNALGTFFACLTASSSYMSKLEAVSIIGYFFMTFQSVLYKAIGLNGGFGLEQGTAAIIAIIIYIAGISLNVIMMELWWNKSGRNFNKNNISVGYQMLGK